MPGSVTLTVTFTVALPPFDATVTAPLLVLFLSRALDGLSGGNISVANAYLADISDDNNRSANFGKMGMWANFGFILGPAIAGVLGATGAGEVLPE